jgi:hypothetical protein
MARPARNFAWLPWSAPLLAVYVFFDFVLLSKWSYGGDWSPLWVAGVLAWSDPARAYDFALLTKLQLPIIGYVGVRPFVYPPTALILLAPLSLLSFRMALACVSIGGVAALAAASSRRETDRLLVALSPPVVFAAIIGQPTLIVAALAVLGLSQLKSNETRAGVLLALAAAVKPTLLVMLPFGLVAGRHWRALAGSAATGAALVIVSLILFGTGPWIAWIEALPRFRELFDVSAPLYRNGITPYALALRLGASTQWTVWAMLPVALLVAVVTFTRTGDWRLRMTAIVGGSLLVSPYAMNYELAALAPVVLTAPRAKAYDLAIPVIWGVALFFNASLLGLVTVYLWAVAALFRASANDRGMERRVDIPAGEDDPRALVGGRLAA